MKSWKALVKGPSGLIIRERKHFKWRLRLALIKVENVLQEQISAVNLNCYRIPSMGNLLMYLYALAAGLF